MKQTNALYMLLHICCTFAEIEHVTNAATCSCLYMRSIDEISRANGQQYWYVMLFATCQRYDSNEFISSIMKT